MINLDEIKFDEKGLVPAIAQDHKTGEVLMFAWMNKESLEMTIKTNFAHYFSRSRKSLWKKGETSGHVQEVQNILIDCDNDCLILKIKQTGVACHTGARTCFFRNLFPALILFLTLISSNANAEKSGKVDHLNIFSENNINYPLVKIAKLYSAKKNAIVSVNFDYSQNLVKSIDDGEPADIFISSHPEWIDSLKKRGLVDVYSITNIARDRLVLIASKNNKKLNADEVKDLDFSLILKIIDQRNIPMIVEDSGTSLGKYSDKFLKNFKGNKNIYRKVMEDKKSITDVVGLNEDYCGIVFASSIRNRSSIVILKDISGSEIYYQALVVAGENMPKARDFLKFVKGDDASKILMDGGFVVD